MKSAKEYWKEKFEEYPQTDADKLAVAMMAEYAEKKAAEALASAVHTDQPVMIPLDEVVKQLNRIHSETLNSLEPVFANETINEIIDHFESQREFWANRDQLRLENQ
jgi:squalene cyclase